MQCSQKQLHSCRTCGFYTTEYEPLWGEDGDSPSQDFCPCCATHAGLGLDEYEQIKERRITWFAKGCTWNLPKYKPADWDLADQLKNIRPDFL